MTNVFKKSTKFDDLILMYKQMANNGTLGVMENL